VITLLSYLKGVIRKCLSLETSSSNRAIPFTRPIFDLAKMRNRLTKYLQGQETLTKVFDEAANFLAGGHNVGGEFCHGQIFSED